MSVPFVPYYEGDGITLYHADCVQVLPFLGKLDLLLTDPPYGISADKNHAAKKGKHGRKYYGESNWDAARPSRAAFHLMLDATSEQCIWGGNYFADILGPSMRWLVWNKCQPNWSMADAEFAWTNQYKAARVFSYHRSKAIRDGKVHPTQKPLDLMLWCLKFFPSANIVLDPFAGSGTTLVAAKMMGLQAIGIERSEEYCALAVERIKRAERIVEHA